MPKNFEEKLPVNKGEKLLPVDETPTFDKSDDRNNEEFINANDPENKFIPINEVPDVISEEETEEEEDYDRGEVVDTSKEIERVRQDIGNYNYQEKGSNGKLESFHVDHDNKEITAIRGDEVYNEPTDPDFIKDAPSEEEFAEVSVMGDRKMSPLSATESARKYKDNRSNASDNLKTMPEAKIQRANRGLIRKFLDTFSKN